MSAKIQIKNDSVRNFGVFFSFVDHFRKDGMEGIVNNTLEHRSMLARYSNSDIFLLLATIFLTGGSCIEDANVFSRSLSLPVPGWGKLCPFCQFFEAIIYLPHRAVGCYRGFLPESPFTL